MFQSCHLHLSTLSWIHYVVMFLDVDECAEGSHDCDVNAYCNNTVGSYQCTCKPAYYGNGKNCSLRAREY